MVPRREFIKRGLLFGASLLVPAGIAILPVSRLPGAAAARTSRKHSARGHANSIYARALEAIPGGTLDPLSVQKYVTPLVIPPAMPSTGKQGGLGGVVETYEISVRQFEQQILPEGLPATTVWSYGSAAHPGTHNYPAFTIEATVNRRVRVKWINELVDGSGSYLPHLLPVDQTLHWANPGGGVEGRDMRPTFTETPDAYTGPVPIVTHVHGASVEQESDGYAEAWFLPNAANIPEGYATTGTLYDYYQANTPLGASWGPGYSVSEYPNRQNATTLWYHDHTLGMTRLNVYAGPAGFYLLRGGAGDKVKGKLPAPAPQEKDKPGTQYYEIPLAIQDRSFNADGSLFFPDTRAFFDGIEGPYIPVSDIAPIWNPEFFGNMMLVNGKTWPKLQVEPRRYRFRLLNGCNSRFLILRLTSSPENSPTNPSALPFWQIGAEGGFLPAPVALEDVLMSPAERADVIVDFSDLPVGTQITMVNLGPDEPFGGGAPGEDFPVSDAETTGQVMQFEVVPLIGKDKSTPPAQLRLPALPGLPAATVTRPLALLEMMSMFEDFDGPAEALLGVMTNGEPEHKMWDDPISENPAAGTTEVWELYNFTADAHPIHIHEVMFKVVNREGLLIEDEEEGEVEVPVQLTGAVRPPEPGETGYKDTVIAYPGEVTRVTMTFNRPGLFVWHCHIVDHEDNEMMRPLHVGPIPPDLPV